MHHCADLGGVTATSSVAAAPAAPAGELSANLRANYPTPPKIVCTDFTAAEKESKKGKCLRNDQ